MTPDEMRAYATAVVEGGSVKKADVVAFMKAFLANTAPDPLESLNEKAVPSIAELTAVELDGRPLPQLYFEIEKTGSGIHVPREANRAYTRQEGYALLAMLTQALE